MTALDAAVAELATLMPALAAALERDTGHGDGAATPTTPGSPVNADVLHVISLLSYHIPAVTAQAREAIGEPCRRPSPPAGCLRQLPRIADRMRGLGLVAEERRLEATVQDWRRRTKLALRFREPDTLVGPGYWCPRLAAYPEEHRAEDPGRLPLLLRAGSEAFLVRARDGLRLEWVHKARVYCPLCGESWGPGQWLMLGRMLQEAS